MSIADFRPSGLTQESFRNMVTGAGALYFNIDYSTVTPSTTKQEFAQLLLDTRARGDALGATDGGCTIELVPRIRQVTVDDLTHEIAGSTVMDGFESVTISTTAKETTIMKLRQVVTTARRNTTTGALEFGAVIPTEQFFNEVTLAIATIGGNLQAYRLKGALNTSGLTITTQSAEEGTYTVEFRGHLKDLADIEAGVAPLSIYEFDDNGMVHMS